VSDERRALILALVVAAIIVGVLVGLTVHHVLREHRARAVNRTLNADHRQKEPPR
jgi:hypothetical protein